MPIFELSRIIDECSSLDNINIKLMKEDAPECKKMHSDHKLPLFEYQKEGVEFGLNHDKWLLLDAPGLGKTYQSICIAEELKERENIEHCLIICGVNALKANWQKEIEKSSKYDSIIIGRKVNKNGTISYTSIDKRAEQLKEKIDQFFVIVNVESLRDKKVIDAILKGKNKFDLIIFDEIHNVKSPKSQQSKGLLKLKAKYQIGLTGTLIINNPLDAYMPLRWIEEETASFSVFKVTYCVMDDYWHTNVVGYKNVDFLRDQINLCSLRRTKNILSLPSKTIIPEFLEMKDDQRKFYQDLQAGITEKVDKVFLVTEHLLGMVTRLRQAVVCPSILSTEKISSVKVDRAAELIGDILSQGEKVVVFSNFKQPLEELKEKIKQGVICTGDITDDQIAENINNFQTDENSKVLLCTLAKMSTGVTLTAATYMIFLDTPWTYALFEQACDRIYRIGTEKKVTIYNLICENTIDERVYALINQKKDISDYMSGQELSDNERLRFLLNLPVYK